MELSNREKAAFILGMTKAFKTSSWPGHWGKPDREKFVEHGVWAHQALSGGCYNPLDAFAVTNLADTMLKDDR